MIAYTDSLGCSGTLRTVFELSTPRLGYWLNSGIPFAMAGRGALIVVANWRKRDQPGKSWVLVFASVYTVSALFLGVLALWSSLFEYRALRRAVESGHVARVESIVTHFIPGGRGDHTAESFTVDGQEFSYRGAEGTAAYHRTERHGGFVHELQYVRIHAVGGKIVLLAVCTSTRDTTSDSRGAPR